MEVPRIAVHVGKEGGGGGGSFKPCAPLQTPLQSSHQANQGLILGVVGAGV